MKTFVPYQLFQGTSAAELLNSQERGALVKHVLESARAEPGDEHALEPALTLRPGQSIGKVNYQESLFRTVQLMNAGYF